MFFPTSSSAEEDTDQRVVCKYGAECYQKNEEHLQKYKHPSKTNEEKPQPIAKRVCRDRNSSWKQQNLTSFFSRPGRSNISKKAESNSTAQSDVSKKPESNSSAPSDIPKKPESNSSAPSDIPKKPESNSSAPSDIPKKPEINKTVPSDIPTKPESNKTVPSDIPKEPESNSTVPSDILEKHENAECSTTKEEDTSNDISAGTSSVVVSSSREEYQRIIKKLFLVDMPEDFFSLWEFCKTLLPENPAEALKSVDLHLVGPFDVLAGTLNENIDSSTACRHWRYYYDPPEFQTVLRSDKSDLFHIGYFRDDPNELPVFLGYNYASKNSTITPIGDNLFAAVEWCINNSQKVGTPFSKMKISNIKTDVQKWAKGHNFSLSNYSQKMRDRDKKTVAKTFHHAGIVVPYNKETELGYRPLSETPINLMKILKQIETCTTDEERTVHMSKLHEVVTWANIAVDEGDYGTTLELGLDLFCFGSKYLNSMITQLLTSSYKLLEREAFATILKVHLQDRKKGGNLNILSSK